MRLGERSGEKKGARGRTRASTKLSLKKEGRAGMQRDIQPNEKSRREGGLNCGRTEGSG